MEDRNIYCIVCTQGEMSYQDVLRECKSQKWVPILVMRLEEGPPIIPCFESTEVARNFARRNLPKSWLRGVVNLTMRDTQWIDKKGWRIVLYDFPKKLKDVVPFDIEVLEYDEEPKIIGI